MDTLELPVAASTPRSQGGPSGTTPRHRAPLMVRVCFGLLAAAGGLTTVALLLSDRAPGLLSRVFGDMARSLWARIDADRRAAIAATGATTETDLVVHVAIWTLVALFVALTIWTWRGLAVAGVLSAAASVVLEFGQQRWADTRAFEWSDLIANLVGVTLGVAGAAAAIATWAAVGAALERRAVRPRFR